jgi:NADH:ubiquinone oxidoreductase subunit K
MDKIYLELYMSLVLTFFGFFGIINVKKNLILILLSIEILYAGIVLNFLFLGVLDSSAFGQIFALIVVLISSAESVLILSLLVLYHKMKLTTFITNLRTTYG